MKDKARSIKEIFPDKSIEEIYELLKKNPGKSIDELITELF